MVTLYFSGIVGYINSNNGGSGNPIVDKKNNEIPDETKNDIEQKSKRFIGVYKSGGIDNIKMLLETKNLISNDMKDNLTKELNNLNGKQTSSEETEPYALDAEPMEVSIADFEKNNARSIVLVKITKTYGYWDENWTTIVWRNPDGTIGDPKKEMFTQEIELDFVRSYDWRIDKVEFLEGSKRIIYTNK